MGASFDKLRTNDLLVYLPLSALKGEGVVHQACISLVGGYFTLTLALSLKGEGILLPSGWLILN